jgi:hypothetical protein
MWEKRLSKVLLTERRYKEMKKEIEKIEAETQESLTIDGMDPIISILKLFNRAYKLYTVNAIPGGRSGGKISRGVANEYTPVGGGGFGSGENLSGTNGPYRNNKIFNMWENAVLDIMRDRKYQKIFTKRSKLRIGKEIVEEAGEKFRRFINDLLDGSKLYGSGGSSGKGVQHEFIDKYFGSEAAGSVKPSEMTLGGEIEAKEIQEVADKVKSFELHFPDQFNPEIKNTSDLRRTIIKIDCEMKKSEEEKEEDPEKESKKRYFFVIEGNDDMLFVVHSRNFGNILKYVENDFAKKGGELRFKDATLRSEPKSDVYLTKMKPRTFINMIKNGNSINLQGHTPDNTTSREIGQQKTLKTEWLCTIEDNKPTKYVLETYSFKDAKGFSTDKLASFARESTNA